MLFEKNRLLGVLLYLILAISCLVQITQELGLHAFHYFKSHHGVVIFSIGGLIDCLSSTWEHFHEARNKNK
jgi:hypothetical protein